MIHYTMSITMHLLHSISISLISTKYGSEDLSIWRAISDSATRQCKPTEAARKLLSHLNLDVQDGLEPIS